MDTLFLHGIQLKTILGALSWEQIHSQVVEVSLDLTLPENHRACQSDQLSDAVNYASLVEDLREHLATQRFTLIETLAEEIAQFVLRKFAVDAVKVRVVKPAILPNVREVGFEITR